ncbi:MAG: hypothetical protein QMD85_03780 [Candidatus Aenigmarchaeota archaeon]|nr:hypothetical protein [Candidatus Aenigmarchaeota archaeon]MDI6722676.1 hypothetical protein [Candidatus Aenigmarchaeota archaeon]
MKNSIGKITGGALIWIAALTADSEAKPFDAGIDVAARSKYVGYYGLEYEGEPVIQSSVTLGRNGFYGVLWSNVNTQNGLTEVDYIAGYGRNVKGIDVDASYNFFDLRNIGEEKLNDNIHEIWINLGRKWAVSPRLRYVKNLGGGNLDHDKGNYVDFALRLRKPREDSFYPRRKRPDVSAAQCKGHLSKAVFRVTERHKEGVR